MGLELVLGDDEEDDEFHRCVVQGIELDAGHRTAKSRYDLVHPVGRSMRDGNSKTDPRAHGFFALAQSGQNDVAIRRLHLLLGNE